MRYYSLFIISLMTLLSLDASASGIVYRGINPDITPTANPYNVTAINNMANQSKKSNPINTSSQLTEAQLLKQSVISGLSSTYQQILTGNCAACGGTVNFGDGSTAVYSTANGVRYITFYNLDGSSTSISFPLN